MKKGQMKTAEKILDEYDSAYQRAENTAEWENMNSWGPTLTDSQIYGLARELWEEFSAEISRQARKGNPHAVKIAAGIAAMKNPGQEAAFSDAWDEYQLNMD